MPIGVGRMLRGGWARCRCGCSRRFRGDREPLAALVRSGPTDQVSAALLAAFFECEITAPLLRAIGTDDAPLRANLISAQLIGLIMTRYLVPIEPLASTPGMLSSTGWHPR